MVLARSFPPWAAGHGPGDRLDRARRVRAVAAWHQKPGLRPRPEMQQVLDAALARAPAAAGERFAVLTGEPAPAVSARADDDGAAAAAEHRLITDQNISRALS